MVDQVAVLVCLGSQILSNAFFEVIQFAVGYIDVGNRRIAFGSNTQNFDLLSWFVIAFIPETLKCKIHIWHTDELNLQP